MLQKYLIFSYDNVSNLRTSRNQNWNPPCPKFKFALYTFWYLSFKRQIPIDAKRSIHMNLQNIFCLICCI